MYWNSIVSAPLPMALEKSHYRCKSQIQKNNSRTPQTKNMWKNDLDSARYT